MTARNPTGEQHVIVVLGSKVRADGRPGARLARRMERAIAVVLLWYGLRIALCQHRMASRAALDE